MRFVTLNTEGDYNGRGETPVGIAGRLRPRRLTEEAKASHHRKGQPGVVINYRILK